MQVLGKLLRLPEDRISLALPWWHRSVLGFLHRTPVYIVLLKTTNRPVGDLIVTALDPKQWNRMKVLVGEHTDSPGVIEKVFESVLPLNIAIAETVTVDSGNKHNICLFLEPAGDKNVEDEVIYSNLKNKGLNGFRLLPYMADPYEIMWQEVRQVEHGWLHGIEWKEQITKLYPDTCHLVDLNKFVVSADTEKRILRYVFPLRGALSISIEHADIPGALKVMTECFVDCGLNVLSTTLTRGGANHHNAILHAVCEPTKIGNIENLNSMVEKRLRALPPEFRARWKISEGEDAAGMIYPRHPDELIARLPSQLQPFVREYRNSFSGEKTPIFISRRFILGERFNKIVERIKKTLRENDCVPIEAEPESGRFYTTPVQVSSAMWASKAGIVLVAQGDGDAFSMNLVHEAGFLQGQGKEVLILVEEGSSEEMIRWTNGAGIVAPRFPNNDRAFNPSDRESLDWQLQRWISQVKSKIGGEYS